MTVFLLSFAFFLFVVAGMAVGVIFSDKPIKGSCGGMGVLGIDAACDICGGNPVVCERETRPTAVQHSAQAPARPAQGDLFYEAGTHK